MQLSGGKQKCKNILCLDLNFHPTVGCPGKLEEKQIGTHHSLQSPSQYVDRYFRNATQTTEPITVC